MKYGKLGAVIAGIVVVGGIICGVMCIEKIPVGYTGVVTTMSSGATGETLNTGWHMVAPTKRVKEFTISNEQLLLTKDKREDSKSNDAFKVSTADDASITISFQMSYRFVPESVVDTYKKFKGMDGDQIVNSRLKAVLKSKVSEVTTDYTMMDIYSGNRSEINNKLTEYLSKEFTDSYGIEVLDASIIDVHPDDKLKESIDNRVAALQKKQQAQAEQETAKVEAETALIRAQNESEIKVKQAEGEAESNRLKASSITPELISMKEAEARLQHGWVTVNGVSAVVTEEK